MQNREWYGDRAREIEREKHFSVIDYGCEGKGMVINYSIFPGIQITFLDFDTTEVFPSQKYDSDIIEINYCKRGRYECEFANHTMTYLQAGYFCVSGTKYLPLSFSFPLKCYNGLSVVIDKKALGESVKQMMDIVPIDLNKIGNGLNLEQGWYISKTPPKLEHIFSELYQARGIESEGYFKIKAMEILYHIDQLTQNKGCDFKYFDKGQIESTKRIQEYMVMHLEENIPLEQLAREAHMNLSVFYTIFSQIYGDTPYAYIKKYKMNLAAQMLLDGKQKIGDIAMELGYHNASKFSKAFVTVYGELPKDYRKKRRT